MVTLGESRVQVLTRFLLVVFLRFFSVFASTFSPSSLCFPLFPLGLTPMCSSQHASVCRSKRVLSIQIVSVRTAKRPQKRDRDEDEKRQR